jgi:hypothetical protein
MRGVSGSCGHFKGAELCAIVLQALLDWLILFTTPALPCMYASPTIYFASPLAFNGGAPRSPTRSHSAPQQPGSAPRPPLSSLTSTLKAGTSLSQDILSTVPAGIGINQSRVSLCPRVLS